MYKILMLTGIIGLFFPNVHPNAAIIIDANDFPASIGTITVTEESMSNNLPVDPGLAGENRTWNLTQIFNGILSPQKIVENQITPFSQAFPDAQPVTKYLGKLGDIVYSYNFNDIAGTIYLYQTLEEQALSMQGIGMISSQFTGPVIMQPAVIYFAFPLEFGKTWDASSSFSIQIDTVMFNIPTKLKTDISLKITSLVDGSGTLILPGGSYKCLRIKSYITMIEKLFVSGTVIRENNSRTIYYYWVAQRYGIVARIISKMDEPFDNFTIAEHVSRLSSFSSGVTQKNEHMDNEIMQSAVLASNFPNPFNSGTTISYFLPLPGFVELDIYNCIGQKMQSLLAQFQQPGKHAVKWNGSDASGNPVPSGVYFSRLIVVPGYDFTKMKVVERKLNLIR